VKDIYFAVKRMTIKHVMDDAGECRVRWIHEITLLPPLMKDGWEIYLLNGFQRIMEIDIDLKMEKCDGCQCAQSPKSNQLSRR